MSDSKQPTTVGDVMTPDPTVVDPGVTVGGAYATMRGQGFRHLPVVLDGQLVGVISTSDVGRLGAGMSAILDQPVGEAMNKDVLTTSPDAPIETAAAQMALRKVNCLPVVVDGRLVGIVTSYDLLDALARRIKTGV